jgi:hypothetical protein
MSNDLLNSIKLNKDAISIGSLVEEQTDLAYWLQKTPEDRLAAVEYLRVMNYGYDPVADRLQRVLTVSELGES